MIDTILFDLDGTLLDTLTDLALSVNYALSVQKLPPRTTEEIRAFVGNGAQNLITRAAPEHTDQDILSKLLSLFNEHYKTHATDHTAPYAGILPLLYALQKEGFLMAVVSNKPAYATEDLCRNFFKGPISLAVGQSENLAKKPAPDMLHHAMKLLERRAENCIYVGDSEVDVKSAQNAGIPAILVDWGFRTKEQLQKAGAHHIVSSPEELFQHILSLKQ